MQISLNDVSVLLITSEPSPMLIAYSITILSNITYFRTKHLVHSKTTIRDANPDCLQMQISLNNILTFLLCLLEGTESD